MSNLSENSSSGAVVKETRPAGGRDRYIWSPLYLGIAVATIYVAWAQFLNFVPFRSREPVDVVRDLLNFLLPLVSLISIVVVLVFAVRTMFALAKGRWRRALSLLCAAVAMPLIVVGGLRLTFLNPYYWHVILNAQRFERAVKAETQAGVPAFVILERRDVSIGIVTTSPAFTAVIYDESDELCAGANGSPDVIVIGGVRLPADHVARPMLYGVDHLHGHFYLVTSSDS